MRRTRGLHRTARSRVPFPVVALVGYTNAGKSTLFNALTGAEVTARDQLFATLDPDHARAAAAVGPARDPVRHGRASSANCRTNWSPRSAPRWRRWRRPTSSCTCATPRIPTAPRSAPTWSAVLDGMVADGALDADWRSRTIEVLNKADLLGGVRLVPVRQRRRRGLRHHRRGLTALTAAIDARIAAGMEVADYDIAPHGRRAAGLAVPAWRGRRPPGRGRRRARDGAAAAGRSRPVRAPRMTFRTADLATRLVDLLRDARRARDDAALPQARRRRGAAQRPARSIW